MVSPPLVGCVNWEHHIELRLKSSRDFFNVESVGQHEGKEQAKAALKGLCQASAEQIRGYKVCRNSISMKAHYRCQQN